jgi:hypothetical protein
MRDQLERKLLAAARRVEPPARVPYAFERRILAAIQAGPALDPWQAWGRVFSRAAIMCVGISLLSSVWFYCENGSNRELPDLEHAVYAVLDHPGVTW